MKRLFKSFLLLLVLLQAGGCFFATRGPEPTGEIAVRANGLPGHPEKVWTDGATGRIETQSLTSETFVSLSERVNPAVVSIFTETKVETRFGDPLGLFTIRTPELDFSAEALGTGFFISPDGFLLTNAHVVLMADEIKVYLWQQSEVKTARLVGLDKRSDLALLKIRPDKDVPYLALARSDEARVGEIVAAIGNPFGLQHSLTDGLISAKHRQIHKGQKALYEDFIQTSAAINPGNSGGPLLNLRGEVVGVNTATIQGGVGIGFAVPSDLVRDIVPHLIRSGGVEPAYIGVQINFEGSEGAGAVEGGEVTEVRPGYPAQQAGLKSQDVVTAVNGRAVRDGVALGRMLSLLPIGKEATLTVKRGREALTLKVTPIKPPVEDNNR